MLQKVKYSSNTKIMTLRIIMMKMGNLSQLRNKNVNYTHLQSMRNINGLDKLEVDKIGLID